MEGTTIKVLNIAIEIGANITEQDISTAHHLPGRGKTKPIIVRFCRRVAKASTEREREHKRC